MIPLEKVRLRLYAVAFFLVVLFGKVGMSLGAEGMSVPQKEQIAKLVELAWKQPITSIDATVYLSITRPQIPRNELEKTVREVYTAIENKSDKKESVEELEKSIAREVDRMIKEQQSPAVIKKRVRWNGIQYREDKVSTEGKRTVVDAKTEFDRVIVNAGNLLLKDFTSFEYDLNKKIASINDKMGSTWKEDTVWNAFGIQPVSMFLKLSTAVPPKPGETDYVPIVSAQKVLELQEDKNEYFYIRTRPDKYKDYSVDRFEIYARQKPDKPIIIFYCDVKDYSKLYRCESFNPDSRELLAVVERDQFDSQGFPKIWITEEYIPAASQSKSQIKRSEHVFEKVLIDANVPADIFEYNPPDDFSTIDYRPAEPIVLEPHERFSGEDKIVKQELSMTKYVLMGLGLAFILFVLGRRLLARMKK